VRRAQQLGRYAAITQLVFAAVLGGFASLHAEPGSFVPRGTVLLAVFALPGIIGWIGARARRPALVAAAALSSGVGAFVAFSGVTLIFLLPAALFLVSALALVVPRPGDPRGDLVSGAGQVVIAVAICALVLGAGASALLLTDSACWIARETPLGTSIEVLPYSTGEITLGADATSGGCSTGIISPRGVGLGAILASAALGLAATADRRRMSPVPGRPGPPSAG